MGINLMGAGPWTKKPVPVVLPSGAAYILPSGQYMCDMGLYTVPQWWDPVAGIWRNIDGPAYGNDLLLTSDGYNVRLFNPTGSVAGAYLTNGGSGYPNGIYPQGTPQTGNFVVATASAGLANFNVIVGGCINTSVTITTGGAGYNNPPTLLFSEPPTGGLKASAIATVSGGAINGVTVINQGAGYTTAPTITIVPHPNDVAGITTPAVLTSALTNSGRVTAVTLGPSGGNGYTGAAIPTIAFTASAGTGAAATAVMALSVTGVSAVSGGVNMVSASAVFNSIPLATAKTNAPVNPMYEQGLYVPRAGMGVGTIAGAAVTAITVTDGGLHQVAAVGLNWALNWTTAALAASPVGTIALGGNTDTSFIVPL